MTQRGYILAELHITDDETFRREYMTRVKPVLKQYDARVLVATDDPEVVEGERPARRIVLIEFPTPDVARAFYRSSAYQDVMAYRIKSASTDLYLLDGITT